MRKLATITLSLAVLHLPFLGGAALAQEDIFNKGCEGVSGSSLCEDAGNTGDPFFSPDGLFADILNIITFIVGIAAVIMIIIGGIQYALSTGDPAKVSAAKDTLIYAAIGIVIVLFAQIIVNFIVGRI